MPAPVSIASTHVHAMRLASGAEALVARVVTTDNVAGYGFSLGTEATPARDMAAWDALGRSRNLPLYALFGRKMRESVAVASGKPDGMQVNPFEFLSLEDVRLKLVSQAAVCLMAPHKHSWELSYCVALAASLPGNVVLAGENASATLLGVSDAPGIAIDWSLEPGFAAIRWYTPGG
jgi:hypothetical protein